MTKPVVVDDAATSELERGVRWYESEREGLGLELADEVERALLRIADGTTTITAVPGISRVDVRRVLLERFPYAIVFVELESALHVVAIAHFKRAPRYSRQRVRRAREKP